VPSRFIGFDQPFDELDEVRPGSAELLEELMALFGIAPQGSGVGLPDQRQIVAIVIEAEASYWHARGRLILACAFSVAQR
jgi:hypothetical protein